MKVKKLYERCLAQLSVDRAEFLLLLERSLSFFASLYGSGALTAEAALPQAELPYSSPIGIDDELRVSELYTEALLYYMEYLAEGEREAKELALASAEGAYRQLWRARAAGRRLKPC